jgi:hypothetical protein
MKTLALSIPTSLGEIINIKGHLDCVKDQYSQIKISFNKGLWKAGLHMEAPDWKQKEALWNKYLDDIGKLFFSESPYSVDNFSHQFLITDGVVAKIGIPPRKVELGHLLCKGEPLNIGPYIVMTTKIRHVEKKDFMPLSIQLWKVLRELSSKYKIVILGEREVEMRREYDMFKSNIFGLYDQIIANLPPDRIVDLTVPALGETVADLSKIQQDCLVMRDAQFVITIGIGGNSCMAAAVSKMNIGYRTDRTVFTDQIFNREYPNAIVTKNWNYFIEVLKRYL